MSPTTSAETVDETFDALLDHFSMTILNVTDVVAPAQVISEQTESTVEKHHDGKNPDKTMQES